MNAPLDAWQPISAAEKYAEGYLLHDPQIIDPDFNPEGVVEGYWQDDEGWIGAVWNPVHDYWASVVINPTHFMRKPKAPAAETAQ